MPQLFSSSVLILDISASFASAAVDDMIGERVGGGWGESRR